MEKKTSNRKTHGMSRTRQYSIWNGMYTRCYNKKSINYPRYGGAGVEMCESWKSSFINFWEDIGDTYFPEAQIDRIDNSKGYSKENCQWVTMREQAQKKSNVNFYTHKGETLLAHEWDKKLGLKNGSVRRRIKYYNWSIEKALTTRKMTFINS